jgi:hypothetical protein
MALGAALLGVLCACQWLDQPREDAEKKALRRRVEDLEAQLRLCTTPRVGVTAPRPGPAVAAAPAGADSATPPPPADNPAPLAPQGATNPQSQEPPASMLPPRMPPAPRTHATVDLVDLTKHVGETLRVTMKDGRTFIGTLKAVEGGTLRMERDMGLGTTSFQLPLADVQQVLRRLDAKP